MSDPRDPVGSKTVVQLGGDARLERLYSLPSRATRLLKKIKK